MKRPLAAADHFASGVELSAPPRAPAAQAEVNTSLVPTLRMRTSLKHCWKTRQTIGCEKGAGLLLGVFSAVFRNHYGSSMATTPPLSELPRDVRLRLEEAIRHAQTGEGDLAILQRIHDEAAKIKREVFAKYRLLDIGTPAIRERRAMKYVLDSSAFIWLVLGGNNGLMGSAL